MRTYITRQFSTTTQVMIVLFIGFSGQLLVAFSTTNLSLDLGGLLIRQFFSAILMFVLPPLLLLKWRGEDMISDWRILPSKKPLEWAVALFTLVALTPLAEQIGLFFKGLENVPQWWSDLRPAQDSSDNLIDQMIESSSWMLLLSFIILVVIPPIGEEFFFRGTIQRLMYKSSPAWWSVLLPSLFFTIMHVQIDNFVSMLLLALALGWLYHRTRALWVTIIAHAAFNGIAFADRLGWISFPVDGMAVWIGLGVAVVLLWMTPKREGSWQEDLADPITPVEEENS